MVVSTLERFRQQRQQALADARSGRPLRHFHLSDLDGVLLPLQQRVEDRHFTPAMMRALTALACGMALVTNGPFGGMQGVQGILARSAVDKAALPAALPGIYAGALYQPWQGNALPVGLSSRQQAAMAALPEALEALLERALEDACLMEIQAHHYMLREWTTPSYMLAGLLDALHPDTGLQTRLLQQLFMGMQAILRHSRLEDICLIHPAPGTADETPIYPGQQANITTDMQVLLRGSKFLAALYALDAAWPRITASDTVSPLVRYCRQHTIDSADLRRWPAAELTRLAVQLYGEGRLPCRLSCAVDTLYTDSDGSAAGSDAPLVAFVRVVQPEATVVFVNSGADAQASGSHPRTPYAVFDEDGTCRAAPLPHHHPLAPDILFASTAAHQAFLQELVDPY